MSDNDQATRAPSEFNMDVKAAIESGDSEALRRLLSEQPARANELIR